MMKVIHYARETETHIDNAIAKGGNEEHQIRNAGDGPLTFVCLVPAGAPEM